MSIKNIILSLIHLASTISFADAPLPPPAGYAGLNLVPQNVTPHQVMLNIYKNGKPHKAIPLGNLMANMNNLF